MFDQRVTGLFDYYEEADAETKEKEVEDLEDIIDRKPQEITDT